MSRHSIKNVLRQVRGARGSLVLTEILYSKNMLVEARLCTALAKLNAAEAELRAAIRIALNHQASKRRAA